MKFFEENPVAFIISIGIVVLALTITAILYFPNRTTNDVLPTQIITPTTPLTFEDKTICAKRLVAYYPCWSEYNGTEWYEYKQDKIPYSKLTHIMHAFITLNADGSLDVPEDFLEPELITNAHAKSVKVLVSVGGAGDIDFSGVLASTQTRTAFINNLEQFIRINGYDGVDIDWESPANSTDRSNQNLFYRELKAKFNSSRAPGPSWQITMASAQSDYGAQWNDYEVLNNYVDFYNIMSYDYTGSWAEYSAHNSPLYKGIDPGTMSFWSSAYDYFTITRGIPAEKINMGIPFYGYIFPTSENVYDNCAGDCANGTTQIPYGNIKRILDKEDVAYFYNEEYISPGTDWTYYYDSGSMVPYLKKDAGAGFITYDDPSSVTSKVQFMFQKDFGGLFIWHLFQDYESSGNQPLLNAMYDGYVSECATTPTGK